jgi:hypothetical protein
MGFRYLVEEHVGKGMMVQMIMDGILKSNYSLFDELFKGKKHTHVGGNKRS